MEFNGTFLATIITFIVFVILMNKILYEPVLAIMEERKSFIDGNYRAASENDAKSVELTSNMEEQFVEAKEEARDKYNSIVDDFKSQCSDIVADAQNASKDKLERSAIELENVSNEVKDGLKSSMTDLANDIVEKVIGYRSEVQSFDNEVVSKVLWD